MSMLVWSIAGTALALLTLPGTIELTMLTIGGLLPYRRRAVAAYAKPFRLGVVIPAHNEQLHIGRAVASVRAARRAGVDLTVVVIADNCEDATADTAARAGARVMVRRNDTERGKGYALDYAFRALLPEGLDAFAVVDADSEVAANFIEETAAMFRAGADAVQCRYLVRNARQSMRTRLMNIALFGFNVLRPRGRERWGLSAGIYGNGFAISTATLRAVPYSATSVVEDLEYHLSLTRAGRKVRFADATAVWGDMPAAGAGVKTQRTRWEGGRFRMIAEHVPHLIPEILRGKFALLEPCLDLVLLPLAFHVTLLLLALPTPFAPARIVALAGLGMVAAHLFAAIGLSGGGPGDFAALLAAPFYIVWKILLLPRLLRNARSGAAWVRTERAGKGTP